MYTFSAALTKFIPHFPQKFSSFISTTGNIRATVRFGRPILVLSITRFGSHHYLYVKLNEKVNCSILYISNLKYVDIITPYLIRKVSITSSSLSSEEYLFLRLLFFEYLPVLLADILFAIFLSVAAAVGCTFLTNAV